MSEHRWYALSVITSLEANIKRRLDTKIVSLDLQDKITETLLPTEKRTEYKNGRKILRRQLSLPGYLLVKAELSTDVVSALISTSGVLGFIPPEEPVPLDDSEIEPFLNGTRSKVVNNNIPEKGRRVRITQGPFVDIVGEVVSPGEEKTAIKIILFNKETGLTLPTAILEKVKDG